MRREASLQPFDGGMGPASRERLPTEEFSVLAGVAGFESLASSVHRRRKGRFRLRTAARFVNGPLWGRKEAEGAAERERETARKEGLCAARQTKRRARGGS